VDGALVLKRQRGEADACLFGDGGDFENPVELVLKRNAITATWTILGNAEEYGMSEQRRAILGVLESANDSSPRPLIRELTLGDTH
jgi:hypothetical protein